MRRCVFYRALFGVEPAKLRPGYAKFDVDDPPLNLALTQVEQVAGNRTSHFGVQVALRGEVQQQAERLQALGLATRMEEDTVCCYSRQDKAWVSDPDGNAWEIFVVLEDAEESACGCA